MSVSRMRRIPIAPNARCVSAPLEHLDWTQQFRSNQFIVRPKHDLLREGEPAEYVYTLFSGWMIFYKSLPSGKRQILRFALPGDLIGFQPVLQAPMNYSVRTLTEVELCAFPRAKLGTMLEERPELATRLALMNARDAALCQHHLLGTGRKSAKERVAFLLLEILYRVRSMEQIMSVHEDGSIDFPVAQEEIGDAVGLTTVHVNRTLKELRDEGLVTNNHRRLTVHDEGTLKEIAQFDPHTVLGHPLL